MTEVQRKGQAAKAASKVLSTASSTLKNKALIAMSEEIITSQQGLLTANGLDVAAGKKKGLSAALLDRLALSPARIKNMAEGLAALEKLPDPIGEVISMWKRPNGLRIGQIRVPLGVVGIIYEARPNVTADAAGLALKAGNAVVLRGGSEAINSNRAIAIALRRALAKVGLPPGCVELIENTSREAAMSLMRLDECLDVLIPRGGSGLIRAVKKNATVPIIETGIGNCHTYVHASANLEMAKQIVLNAKCNRPGVCNACETLLVDAKIAAEFVPLIVADLQTNGVEIRGCPQIKNFCPEVLLATEEDFRTEFLDYVVAAKVVAGLDEAIEHINDYGSRHSEAIVTSDYAAAQHFLDEIDAAAVYVNASTRFTDGFEFGLGAEMGISTQKLHARGPMGVKELTAIKYIIYGSGQIR
jgi:glutamate-5-semialdehyde dehydrogenase